MSRKNSKSLPNKEELEKIRRNLQILHNAAMSGNPDVIQLVVTGYQRIIDGLIAKNLHLLKTCRKHNIDPESD